MQAEEHVPVKDRREAAKWLLGKLREDRPKAQIRGPIRPGPRGYRVCKMCTRLFADQAKAGRKPGTPRSLGVAVPTRRWKKHQGDHKLGRIRAVPMQGGDAMKDEVTRTDG